MDNSLEYDDCRRGGKMLSFHSLDADDADDADKL